ncbi:hypothetical protein XELAEV_18013173mg [Xenopus laevis]|uniref:Uncharacterized protein n=1 Tax=Xenopus laevis TaxID=8355 RepID=A0A974DRN2_XENLA|nr:hypothetical protein XELAEV_18013173mg [Xenopus laevis]
MFFHETRQAFCTVHSLAASFPLGLANMASKLKRGSTVTLDTKSVISQLSIISFGGQKSFISFLFFSGVLYNKNTQCDFRHSELSFHLTLFQLLEAKMSQERHAAQIGV